MEQIRVSKKDDTYMVVDAEASLLYEIKEAFTFEVPNAKYHPKVKMKIWDGKISLITFPSRTMYVGLLGDLKDFCKERDYELIVDESLLPFTSVTPKDIFEFVKGLNIHSQGKHLGMRDYQLAAIYHSIHDGRLTLISPTASGKSYILYCILRWILRDMEKRILIIVPDLALVQQMYEDFVDYSSANGFDAAELSQMISEGATKVITSNITISTWQSIQYQKSEWLNQFDAIMCDEVHTADAKSIRGIMERANHVPFKLGATGTLKGSKTHKLVITGLFGRIVKVITTAELMEAGHIAELDIRCILLQYQSKEECRLVKGGDYPAEMNYICGHDKRNEFIVNLAINCKGNTLVLFNFVEKHGAIIYEQLRERLQGTNRKVFFIHGDVEADDRNAMRAIVEKEDDAIIVASYGTMSRGTNIRRLHNIIAASPTKSLVRLLQSIGRGLRKGSDKLKVKWFDIVDDFTDGKKGHNYTFDYFIERLKIYTDEKFNYKIVKIKI